MGLFCLILDKSEEALSTFLGLMSNYDGGDEQLLYKVSGCCNAYKSHEFSYHSSGA